MAINFFHFQFHSSVPNTVPGGGSRTVGCDKIHLHEGSQTLFLVYQGSVYGYELDKGTLTRKFANLHDSTIISICYLPEQEALVTSTVDSGGTVRKEARESPQDIKRGWPRII